METLPLYTAKNSGRAKDCALIGSRAHAVSTKAVLLTTYLSLWDSYNLMDIDP